MDLYALEPVTDPETRHAFKAFRRAHALGEPAFDPYYTEEIRRFDLREDDVLVGPGDVHVERASCGAVLGSAQAHARIEVCGVSETDVTRVLRAIDGARTAGSARREAGVTAEVWERILTAGFGTLLFAPAAVANLEGRVSGTEIVRFAGSPYEIVRTYWENMGSLAAGLGSLGAALESTEGFVRRLRELHAVALVGESGRSFYRPASPILEKESLGPGELLRTEPVVRQTEAGLRFVSGPRVGAGLIGGALYHELLGASVRDEAALASTRNIVDDSGLSWGSLVTARAEGDAGDAPWFCPPRPLSALHFEVLRSHLVDASRAEPALAVLAIARFHWSFVRLHPFAFANQSVGMSITNHLLRRSLGAGLSHLVLDHLALRLSRAAYTRAFQTAVRAWLVRDESPVRRTLELVARKRRAFDFLRALGAAKSPAEARRMASERPEDALLVFLSASPSE